MYVNKPARRIPPPLPRGIGIRSGYPPGGWSPAWRMDAGVGVYGGLACTSELVNAEPTVMHAPNGLSCRYLVPAADEGLHHEGVQNNYSSARVARRSLSGWHLSVHSSPPTVPARRTRDSRCAALAPVGIEGRPWSGRANRDDSEHLGVKDSLLQMRRY